MFHSTSTPARSYTTIKVLYDSLVNKLTLKQYVAIMGGDMSYGSKAARAKAVSKSVLVHAIADSIINLTKGE